MQPTSPNQSIVTRRSWRGRAITGLAAAVIGLSSSAALGQIFNGTYNLSGGGNNVSTFAYNGTSITDLTPSDLTKVGITSSSSTNNFRGSNWSTAASADVTKYIQFTLTASPGKLIDLPTIGFGIGRSSTGPTKWEWRSSVDAYATAIPVTTVNAGLTHAAGVLTNPDSNSSWTANEIVTSGAAYEGLSSVTFRLYGYGAEASGGTGGLQGNLTFSGTLVDDGADEIAPEVVSLSPVDGATDVPVNTTLSITFNESVQAGTGNVVLYEGANVVDTFDITTDAVFTGSTVTFTPAADLDFSTSYHVIVPASAIEDLSGNAFAGLLVSTDWNFTTAGPVTTPIISSFSPTSGGAGTAVTITGENFTGSTAVQFAGANAASFTVNSDTEISAVAPDPVVTGKIAVTNADGTGESADDFVSTDFSSPQTVTWNATTASPSSTNPDPLVNLTVSAVSQYNNNGTTTLSTTTSASSGYTGSTGTNNFGAAARIGALNTAPSGSAAFEFTLTPAAGQAVVLQTISFGSRSTSTGPQAYTLRSSADGYATDIVTGSLANNSAWALNTQSGLTFTSETPTTFRLFGHSGAGSASANTANWRIDDLQLTVLVQDGADPIDEPSVSTVVVSNIQTNAADVDASVTNEGSSMVSERGFVFAEQASNSAPEIGGTGVTQVSVGDGPGAFNTTLSSLSPATDYVVSAYAINSFGTSYSAPVSFTTAAPVDTSPVVVSLTPADGATGVSVGTDLVVVFDQNILAGTGDVEIYDASDDSLVESITITSGMIVDDTLTVSLTNPLDEFTTYYVLVDTGAVENAANEDFAGISSPTAWTFTTEFNGYFVDFEGVDETKPGYASGTVNLSGIDWNMTEALIGTDANDSKNGLRSARLRGYGASAMTMLQDKPGGAGTISFDYRRYGTDTQVAWIVEYSTNAGVDWTQVGSPFTAPATNDVQTFSEQVDVLGNVRIRIIQDGTAGTSNRRLNIDDIVITDFGTDEFGIVSLTPANNATDVGISTSLTLNFTDTVVAGTGNVSLFAAADPVTPVQTFAAADGSFTGASVTFTPASALAYDTEYFVTVDANAFTDVDENPFAGIASSNWTFNTESEPIPQPPLVVRLSPETDAIDVPAGDLFLEIEYDVNVVRGTGLLQVFDLDDFDIPPTPVASFDVSDLDEVFIEDNIVAMLLPVVVEAGKFYYVAGPAGLFRSTIGDIASEPFGFDTGEIYWAFGTAVPDTTPPTLVSTTPQSGLGASVSPNFSATFDEPVSLGDGPWTVTVFDVTANEAVIDYTEASVTGISAGGNQIAITLPADLEFNNTYRVTLTEGVVQDASGNLSPAITGSTWEFTTGGPFVAGQVVISQVYGGGGNSGATLRNDFIELYNRSEAPISLSGWSVQYASATGTSWAVTPLTGTIQPGGYYLVQQAAGTGGTQDLPTPDDIGTIAMSGTNGKVALVNSITGLTGNNPSTDPSVSDFVGYGTADGFEGSGAAPGLSNTTAAIREVAGSEDTDDNAADFVTGAPSPRNSDSPPFVPGGDGSGVAVASNGTPSSGSLLESIIFPAEAADQSVRIELVGTFVGSTIDQVEIAVPADFGTPLTGNVALSGTGLGSGSAIASGQTVTISGLSLTETTELAVVIGGLTAPDVSIDPGDTGERTFTVRTASSGGTLTEIVSSPSVRVAVPVSDLAALRAVTLPSVKAYLVPNEVVVTYVESGNFRNQHYIQDSSAGILIDDQPVTLGASYLVGDGLENLVGSLSLFQGMLQFNPIAGTADLSSSGNAPAPIVLTLDELTASPLTYQSRLVKVNGINFQDATGNFANNSVHTLEQGADTFAFRTFFGADYSGTAIPDETINLVAIVRTLTDSSPSVSARSLADFEAIPDLEVVSLSPANGAVDVAIDTDLVATFSETIEAGSGNLEVYASAGDVLVESIAITSSMVSGNTLTVPLSANLAGGTSFYVLIDAGAVESLDATPFAGIALPSEWTFTTIDAPPADDFAAWIDGFDVGGLTGPNDNPSGDGIPNLLKHILGLNPELANNGSVVEVSEAGAGTITFVHNLAKDIAEDVEYGYEWSVNLTDWASDGGTMEGVTVEFTAPAILDDTNPDYDVVEVDANVTSGTPPRRIYTRIRGQLEVGVAF